MEVVSRSYGGKIMEAGRFRRRFLARPFSALCAAILALPLLSSTATQAGAVPRTDVGGISNSGLKVPKSHGEQNSGFSYVPLDPLPVQVGTSRCGTPPSGTNALMLALPDNAVRMAMQEITADGSASFGPVTLGAKGKTYRVILDFVSVDTTNVLCGWLPRCKG